MKSITTQKMFLALAITGILAVPAYGIVSAQSEKFPIIDLGKIPELPEEIKQSIKERAPSDSQPYIEEIFKFAKYRHTITDDAKKHELNRMIEETKARWSEAEEQRRQAYLKDTEALRTLEDSIRELDGIPLLGTFIKNNTLHVDLHPDSEDQGWREKVLDMITDKSLNVSVSYTTVTYTDLSCSSRTDDCDPLYGGLRIENSDGAGCTLGLPVMQDNVPGHITAGHCFGNEDVYQPYDHWFWDWRIGTISSDNNIDNNDCDCTFITGANSRTAESKVWMKDWYLANITGTEIPSKNDTLVIAGATSDWWSEDVDEISFIDTDGLEVILLTDSGISSPGDSGAPVFDWANKNLVGILKGKASVTRHDGVTSDYLAVIPWHSIADSTNGLGVSLL